MVSRRFFLSSAALAPFAASAAGPGTGGGGAGTRPVVVGSSNGLKAAELALQRIRPAAACLVTNLSVTGARIESQKSLPQDEDEFDLEFILQAPPNNQEVRVRARAAVRNISALASGPEPADGFAYGVQFTSLNPAHYTLLQNMTYEALLVDRQKIV